MSPQQTFGRPPCFPRGICPLGRPRRRLGSLGLTSLSASFGSSGRRRAHQRVDWGQDIKARQLEIPAPPVWYRSLLTPEQASGPRVLFSDVCVTLGFFSPRSTATEKTRW